MNHRILTRTPDRKRGGSRRPGLAIARAAVALAVFGHLWAQSGPLTLERDGDRLRVSVPPFHFLAGTPLERLHDGRSVTYVFTISLEVEHAERGGARVTRQVVFSYDLWEERFSVARVDDPKASASHLTAAAAEAWCLELLALPARAAPADKTFVVKLDGSWREEDGQPADATAATTLTGLIDVLSRKARAAPPHWEAASLPLRLADVKDKAAK
jgi:hypothetical protein